MLYYWKYITYYIEVSFFLYERAQTIITIPLSIVLFCLFFLKKTTITTIAMTISTVPPTDAPIMAARVVLSKTSPLDWTSDSTTTQLNSYTIILTLQLKLMIPLSYVFLCLFLHGNATITIILTTTPHTYDCFGCAVQATTP